MSCSITIALPFGLGPQSAEACVRLGLCFFAPPHPPPLPWGCWAFLCLTGFTMETPVPVPEFFKLPFIAQADTVTCPVSPSQRLVAYLSSWFRAELARKPSCVWLKVCTEVKSDMVALKRHNTYCAGTGEPGPGRSIYPQAHSNMSPLTSAGSWFLPRKGVLEKGWFLGVLLKTETTRWTHRTGSQESVLVKQKDNIQHDFIYVLR